MQASEQHERYLKQPQVLINIQAAGLLTACHRR